MDLIQLAEDLERKRLRLPKVEGILPQEFHINLLPICLMSRIQRLDSINRQKSVVFLYTNNNSINKLRH